MKRSPSSSCSSSSSSSCVVPAASCDSPEQPEEQKKPKHKRARKCRLGSDDGPNNNAASPVSGRRSSIHRGVTRHRWTGRFEAHLWDKSSWNNIQNKKGRQVYLGAYDSEEAAARTYDLAALKYWGPGTTLNFPIEEYKKEVEEMQNVSKEEYLASLRRRSSGFSRGVSKYRGVARHHHNGRWEARIGRVLGNKYLYLGTYNTQEEAAAAYDMAAIQYRGANAVTNFDISNYIDRLKKKGVHVDLPKQQQQLEQQTTPNFTVNDKQIEIEVKQQQHQQQPKKKRKKKIAEIEETIGTKVESIAEAVPIPNPPSQQLQYTRFSQCVGSPSIVDPVESQELDHPWSFCMDVDGSSFPSLTVSDLPFEKYSDLLDDCKGFEDNIDLIFEVGPDECVLDIVEPNAVLGREVTGQEALLMSTCSPTSSDSCNYCSV